MLRLSKDSDQDRVATSAAAFITSHGPEIHISLAGSSRYNKDLSRFEPNDTYSSLEQLLMRYLPDNLGVNFENDAKKLEELSETLTNTEQNFDNQNSGFWRSLWGGIGEGRSVLDGWVALIPNEYGLSVVKMGLAIVFKLAERSVEKRMKIFQVFSRIRDALACADPARRSFRGDKDVSARADDLTQTIVDSIEDMILLTTKNRPSWRKKLSNIPKFSQKPSPSDLEGILAKIERSTAEFERVVNLVRDQTIEVTGLMTHAMTSQMSVVQDDMHQARDILERFIEKDDRRHEDTVTLCKFIFSAFHQIAERENALQRSQLQARNGLMEVLKQGQMHRLEMKKIQQKLGKVARPSSMITEDELLQILLNSYSDPAELSLCLQQPNKDLDRVLSNKGRHSEDIQVEIQTCLLHHKRILQWIESINSDLVLVDAHLYNASMPKISAASVFSASFITTLLSTSSDAVVVHYFCGVHLTPNDKWFGPKGLIRFITMQLLLRLMATHKIDLDFIDSREFVQDLEDHDFSRLCDLLYTIIEQFSEEVTIWCVIDSIQRFDKPSTLADLRSVMEFLHCLVNDTTLGPAVKIFMTNPNHSKRSITQLPTFQSDPTRLISLRPTSAKAARRLSDRVIGDQLSQALDYRLSENDAEY